MWIGFAFLALGAIPLVVAGVEVLSRPAVVTLCLIAIGIGTLIIATVAKRAWGVKVEKRAIHRLKMPEGWRKEPNKRLTRGDLDVLIVSPEHDRFAVEIKSFQGVSVHRSAFGKTEELRYRDGRRFSKDPVAQVLMAAEEVNGKPVLWLPEAKKSRPIKLRCGVVVIQGNARDLLKGIGAIRSWF